MSPLQSPTSQKQQILASFLPAFSGADLAVIDLEVACGPWNTASSGPSRWHLFRAQPVKNSRFSRVFCRPLAARILPSSISRSRAVHGTPQLLVPVDGTSSEPNQSKTADSREFSAGL